MGELIDLNSTIPASRIDPAMATDVETAAAIANHERATDPHTQYATQARGDERYRQKDTQTFTPTIKSISTSSGGISAIFSSTTQANKCGFEIQSAETASAAFISFHRINAYGVHFGLDINNRLSVGGWSMGEKNYHIFHEGIPLLVKAPLPTASLGGNSFATSWNSVQLGQGIAELCNYAGLGGGDAFNFFRMPGNADAVPTLTNRVSRIDINGAYVQTSDSRVKSGFLPAPGLSVILALLPQKYQHWECLGIDENKTLKLGKTFKNKIGFVAQDVQKILPEAVPITGSEEELYGIDYSQFIPVLVQAIQELEGQVKELRALLTFRK